MTNTEAKERMRAGLKVSHTTFTYDEWATIKGIDTVLTNDGYVMYEEDFWKLRTSKIFETGWDLFT